MIVPSYRGQERVGGCLDSLGAQTASFDEFEAVVVQNGPQTGTREVVAAWREAHPDFQLTYLETEVASVTNARNLALNAATGEYVTFVDDDDRVAPRFVEALLAAAAADVVPVVIGSWVKGETAGDFDHPAGPHRTWEYLRQFVGQPYTHADIAIAMHPVWGKLVRTDVAREVRFDDRLALFADDTIFWLQAVMRNDLRLVLTDLADDAAYLYWDRPGSLSRPDVAPSWDTHVRPALATMAALSELNATTDPEFGAVGRAVAAFAGGKIADYVEANPGDAARVGDELRAIGWY